MGTIVNNTFVWYKVSFIATKSENSRYNTNKNGFTKVKMRNHLHNKGSMFLLKLITYSI